MLPAQIDAVLAEFTRQRIPFSDRDVADRIPDLPAVALSLVRRYVYRSMAPVSSYRIRVAHFVGEGPTVMYIPSEVTQPAPRRHEAPAPDSAHPGDGRRSCYRS